MQCTILRSWISVVFKSLLCRYNLVMRRVARTQCEVKLRELEGQLWFAFTHMTFNSRYSFTFDQFLVFHGIELISSPCLSYRINKANINWVSGTLLKAQAWHLCSTTQPVSSSDGNLWCILHTKWWWWWWWKKIKDAMRSISLSIYMKIIPVNKSMPCFACYFKSNWNFMS